MISTQIKQVGEIGGVGNTTVVTAGTAVPLSATSIPCTRVIVHAASGHIVVGDSSVVYAQATRKGVWLSKTQRETFYVKDVSDLYIDSASDGIVTSYYYEII